jgi:hypothetical protein
MIRTMNEISHEYHECESEKPNRNPRIFIFSFFFFQIREDKNARLYSTMLITRRIAFLFIIMILNPCGIITVFSLMALIQLFYFVQLCIVRPFNSPKKNIIELLNELFILSYI